MGTVYKAWQVSLKRVVALKVIRADAYADTAAAARFHAEAEAAARFQHPNIVQVFEVGETRRAWATSSSNMRPAADWTASSRARSRIRVNRPG